ncbi:MAG TPA: diphosphomevalonate decarboxylase [Polyangiaceae bacterium]|nr:diphosphomevalonate decarboxylase [Polyangiaceae bacterium]
MTASKPGFATAVAHANIALAKYWGKQDSALNLPAVPSLSMTLSGLHTQTSVHFDSGLAADQLLINGQERQGRELQRVSKLLATVRSEWGESPFATVESQNNFPTAAGLASSASGFAALALAALAATGLKTPLGRVSALARAASASAARSAFGGYVVLEAGASEAVPFLPGEHFPLVMLVTVLTDQRKEVPSTQAMEHTAKSSPYYPNWVGHAPRVFAQIRDALRARDFTALGPAVEHSTLAMHATLLAAEPGIVYLQPETLHVMKHVRQLRDQGMPIFFTMDAGPHVKALTLPEHAAEAERELARLPQVLRVIPSSVGPDAHVVN